MSKENSKTPNPSDSNQITRDYFDSLLLEMRHLDSQIPNTELELFGETFQTPIMMAALSHLSSVHENGMVEMAKGAAKAGACMWCGMGDKQELEEIVSTGAKTIKIIKPYEDRDRLHDKISHGKQCGAIGVGIDIDHQFGSNGKQDEVLGFKMKPISTKELKELVAYSELPFVVKGILSVQDAAKCMEAGVSAIVVSHHHGIMPYAVPPLMVLPEIAAAVNGKMKVFVDCGFMSGMDAYKALALGGDAVSVGREMMDALRKNGAAGVTERIHNMTEELAGVMARTCVPDLQHFDASVIRRK